MKNPSEDRKLGRRLRAERPKPGADLVSAIVARVGDSAPRRQRRSYRLAFAGGLTVVMLVALASVGGMSYAANQISHAASAVKQTLSPEKGKVPTSANAPGAAKSQYSGDPPVIKNFAPKTACMDKSMNIQGDELAQITDVEIGGTSASFKVSSNNGIKATVPYTGDGSVTVTGPNGSTSMGGFEYDGPKVGNFQPGKGAPTTVVNIKGRCFMGATSVTFNGTSAAFTVNSNTNITATVPGGATDGKIAITTPAGTEESGKKFNVTGP